MKSPPLHISICICTYRRPAMLARLLNDLSRQATEDKFTFSVVIADNDADETARQVVADFTSRNAMPVIYCVEARRNIALARNQTVAHAHGDYIAFIDDDEFPADEWLQNMFRACTVPGVSGVLGPVVSHYESETPKWVRAGGFYERQRHATGFKLDWPECRTGNVLFARRILADLSEPFRTQFGSGGEDQDFFRRLIELGHEFVWCDEGVVYETVPANRCKRWFMIKRALLRGQNILKHPTGRAGLIARSLVAAPLYVLALPFLLVAGHHLFMKYLVRFCDHAGRLLAVLGLNPVHEREM